MHMIQNKQQYLLMLARRAAVWQQEAHMSASVAMSKTSDTSPMSKTYWQGEAAYDAENARNALFALLAAQNTGEW